MTHITAAMSSYTATHTHADVLTQWCVCEGERKENGLRKHADRTTCRRTVLTRLKVEPWKKKGKENDDHGNLQD